MENIKSFFSISFDLVLLEENLPYDLYINSSTLESREKFVRIFPKEGRLSESDLQAFRKKYFQLYVPESQRDAYLKSLTKCSGVNDLEKSKVIKDSAVHYLSKVFDPSKEYTTEVLEESIQGCRDSVEGMIDVIEDYDITQVKELIASLSFHDFYTYDHSINVAMYSIAIFKSIKKNAKREELVLAGLGGLLHDLGKIKIPTNIINNPGKLSDEDFEVIKKHPKFGGDLLGSCQCHENGVDFRIVQRVILEHHENYNGTGYPLKLEGEQIHVMARITAIADFFDAITTKRSYHEVLSTEDALQVMSRSVGRKIDPQIFDIFCKNVGTIIMKGKSHQEIADDFDPCQPHNVLPLEKSSAQIQQKDFFKKDKAEFGKVKVQTDPKKKKVA